MFDFPKERATPAAEATRRCLNRWIEQDQGGHTAQAETLPLRRDATTLLTYLRDNKVVGTQSTGNLPLKDVHKVTARFVHPPKLERVIGGQTFRVRSEDKVWPLAFLHTLANTGSLLEGGPARRWRLTKYGEKFLVVAPPVQIWALFATWWDQVDWIMAYPFVGMGEQLPPRFKEITLAHLLLLPADTRIPFEPFADRLIQATGLKWTSADTTFHRTALHGAIKRMVIHMLANFGMSEREYQDRPLGQTTIQELVAFKITSFGKGPLEAISAWHT